ncbi:SsgA family sporulation/cell division regulator [Streptomyces sp. NPDC047072]|uniref:SsgA family sporulation/cell division regulator n=1 Tax=Streptomyces sp. NPDC047072 TaxID=3154809 RepID=UPI0033EE54EC
MRHTVLEQTVRARLLTTDQPDYPIRPTLRYSAAEPFAVHVDFPAHVSADGEGVSWMFGRALLEEGLDAPAGMGDVRIEPYGWARTVVEFRSPLGLAVVRFGTASLRRFLQRTYDLVAPGTEDLGPELDHGLASLLDEV